MPEKRHLWYSHRRERFLMVRSSESPSRVTAETMAGYPPPCSPKHRSPRRSVGDSSRCGKGLALVWIKFPAAEQPIGTAGSRLGVRWENRCRRSGSDSLNGTKIHANASRRKAKSAPRAARVSLAGLRVRDACSRD